MFTPLRPKWAEAARRRASLDFLQGIFRLRSQSLLPALQIIKVIFHRSLIGTGDFFLAECALGVRLGGGGGFFVLDFSLAFDADAFQRDTRHLATGRELAF